MQRRTFIKGSAASIALSQIPLSKVFSSHYTSGRQKIKPPKLNAGDTVALVAPASFITEEELHDSVANINKLGLKVIYSKNILAKRGHLAGDDKIRAEDVNEMFSLNEVKGIVCARGGYGASRILPALDYELIKRNPKIFIGYSDITSLLYGIYSQTGLVCFHGPVGISTFNDFSLKYMQNLLMTPESELRLISDESNKDPDFKIEVIRSGIAEGELVGGNLSLAVSVIGTKYDVDYSGKILFLEEIDETPQRVDRMLTQLEQSGKLDAVTGVAMGVFKDSNVYKGETKFEKSLTLSEIFYDRFYHLNIPVIYGLSFGHIENKFTLPFGINSRLNTMDKSITLLETAVV